MQWFVVKLMNVWCVWEALFSLLRELNLISKQAECIYSNKSTVHKLHNFLTIENNESCIWPHFKRMVILMPGFYFWKDIIRKPKRRCKPQYSSLWFIPLKLKRIFVQCLSHGYNYYFNLNMTENSFKFIKKECEWSLALIKRLWSNSKNGPTLQTFRAVCLFDLSQIRYVYSM